MLGVWFLIVVVIELAFGCQGGGGGGYYGGYGDNSFSDYRKDIGKAEEGKFGAFPVPPELQDKWVDFMERYQKDQEIRVIRNLTDQEKADDQRLPEFGWPDSWKDLNAGDNGLQEIPPWGWEPSNDENLPTYCFLPLVLGNSTGIGDEVCTTEQRFAYNAFIKNCLPFEYLGCGGNTNNFVNIELCTEQCMPHPLQGGCDPNVMQLISTLSDLDEEWGGR